MLCSFTQQSSAINLSSILNKITLLLRPQQPKKAQWSQRSLVHLAKEANRLFEVCSEGAGIRGFVGSSTKGRSGHPAGSEVQGSIAFSSPFHRET